MGNIKRSKPWSPPLKTLFLLERPAAGRKRKRRRRKRRKR
jgi:hypothetical protein